MTAGCVWTRPPDAVRRAGTPGRGPGRRRSGARQDLRRLRAAAGAQGLPVHRAAHPVRGAAAGQPPGSRPARAVPARRPRSARSPNSYRSGPHRSWRTRRPGTYAALASYGAAASLLSETFPLGRTLEATALRRRTARTAQRLETDLGTERVSFIDTCPAEWAELPRRDLPLVVGLDGGYVHSSAQTSRRDGWFEVIAGRSIPTGGGKAKCFAYTQTYDTKPSPAALRAAQSPGDAGQPDRGVLHRRR